MMKRMYFKFRSHFYAPAAAAAVALLASTGPTVACPFCSVESRTLTEEIGSSDATVLAKLVSEAEQIDISSDNDAPAGVAGYDVGKATFEIVEVLRGPDDIAADREIGVVYFGEGEADKLFLISGIRFEQQLEWTTPLPLSASAVDYVRKLCDVPVSGADRLAFFQEYFESDDPLLAQDAYDEFARAPYSELLELKDRMHHDRLVKWIQSSEVNPSRRRLYLTLLGICGNEDDVPMIEDLIVSDYGDKKSIIEALIGCGFALHGPLGLPIWNEAVNLDERRKKLGLDAIVGCYLALRGAEGLNLIDERFLQPEGIEFAHVYSTIMALRTMGEESQAIPRVRLLQSMRLLLDKPDFADQVVPDLARWEDWSVLDRLVEMYTSSEKNSYVRQPVVTYLVVASEQPGSVGERATTALGELETFDPEGVKKARNLMAFGFLARARGTNSPATPATPVTISTTSAEDTGGFVASADEVAAAEQAEPSEFQDPAASDGVPPSFAGESDELVESEVAVDDDPTTREEAGATPLEKVVYSRPLVIGAPLAAAVLLMGLYWVILRIGGV